MNVMRILTLGIAGSGLLICAQTQDAKAEFDFAREIGTILTRKGCNGAGCHGGVKGRGGFKLSSGAFHPKEDYEWIVKGGTYQVLTTEVKGERVPRVKIAEPEKSLLLLKATGAVSHGGGKRFDQDSPEYRKLVAWIRSGAPFGREPRQENRVVRLVASPRTVTLEKGGSGQLAVTAHFADGRTEVVTDQALFVSNSTDIASVDETGTVRGKNSR